MNIDVMKTRPDAIVPQRETSGSAGFDLHAIFDQEVVIIPGCHNAKINTGLAMAIPEGYVGLVFARSGLASKQGLRPSNCVGVIDSDYRGEIMVSLYNDSHEERIIENGERIAQIVIVPFLPANLTEVDCLSDTKRGAGGFGSTGLFNSAT